MLTAATDFHRSFSPTMEVNCLITNISYFVYNRGKKFIQVWISVSILFEFSFLGELSL